ncbi:phosphotransferase [Catenuloplanes japonicus]|uniref:phosphotransferase n=1 Tax=Catenuloplanes japonicus TaxID=33876 RepID=UPI0005241CB2|nr:phosphotransferase [Catenuloplanes japonicus]
MPFQICADGRFIPVPSGVFFHEGPMTTPVDLGALTRALTADRVAGGGAAVFLTESALADPAVVHRVRLALDDVPEMARHGMVLGSTEGETHDPARWETATETIGLQKQVPFREGTPRSPRIIGVDAQGRETAGVPEAIRVLPRAQAAARETLKAAARLAADPARSPWERLETLLAEASARRDELGVRRTFAEDVPQTAYQMAVGLVLLNPGVDLDALTRAVLPPAAAEVDAVFGGGGERIGPVALHARLAAVPGASALVRTGDRARWLVSRDGTVYWVDAALDVDPVARFDPTADDPRTRELTRSGTTVTVTTPTVRPVATGVRPDGQGGFLADAGGVPVELLIRQDRVAGRDVMVLLSDDEWARLSGGDWLPPSRDGLPVVAVHNERGYVRVPARRNGVVVEVLLAPGELAAVTARLGADQTLLSCDTAVLNSEFLQGYASALHGTVLAAQGDVLAGSNAGSPVTRGGEPWLLFTAEGAGEPWDTLNEEYALDGFRSVDDPEAFRAYEAGEPGSGVLLLTAAQVGARAQAAVRAIGDWEQGVGDMDALRATLGGDHVALAHLERILSGWAELDRLGRRAGELDRGLGSSAGSAEPDPMAVASLGRAVRAQIRSHNDAVEALRDRLGNRPPTLSEQTGAASVPTAAPQQPVAAPVGTVAEAVRQLSGPPATAAPVTAEPTAALPTPSASASASVPAASVRAASVPMASVPMAAEPIAEGRMAAWPAAVVPAAAGPARQPHGWTVTQLTDPSGTVRFTRDGRTVDLRVITGAFPESELILDPDTIAGARTAAIPGARLHLPDTLPTDGLAQELLWAAEQVDAAGRSRLDRRLRQVVWSRSPAERLAPGGRPRLFRSLAPADRARVRTLIHLLTPPDPAARGTDIADALAELGVLGDQSGSAPRAQALDGELRAAGVPEASIQFVRDRLYDTRAATTPSALLESARSAAAIFAETTPRIMGAGLTKEGDHDVLRLRLDGPHPLVDDDENILRLRIVESPRNWRSRDVARLDLTAKTLTVSGRAGDAALQVTIAGLLARDLVAPAVRGPVARGARGPAAAAAGGVVAPGAGGLAGFGAGVPVASGSGVPVASGEAAQREARRLMAEEQVLRRLRNGSAGRIARWGRAKVWRLTLHQRLFDALLDRHLTAMREHLREHRDVLPLGLRADLWVATHRATWRADEAAPQISDKPGLELHAARRVTSVPVALINTIGTGLLAGRAPHLYGASLAGQGAAALPQAWSDAANARMSAGVGPAKDRLTEPGAADPTYALFRAPEWALPTQNVIKRSPSGLAQSIASMLVAGGVSAKWDTGVTALGLTVLANLVQAELDHVFDNPEGTAGKRYAFEHARTWDKLRNDSVESAYYRLRELMRRAGTSALHDAEKEALEESRTKISDMMAAIGHEVDIAVGEMVRRRNSPWRGSATAETFDLIARGLGDGSPSRTHNAMRVGGQHASAQLPSLVLGLLANSAVDLVTMNIGAAAASGAVYGAGWSGLKRHEFADLVAIASWDTLHRLRYMQEAIDYLLDATRVTPGPNGAVARPPVAIDERPEANPANSVTLRLTRKIGLRRLAEARAQARANANVQRPREVSGTSQMLYKHVPSFLTHMVAAGVMGAALQAPGAVVGVAVAVGGVAKLATGVGENLLRVSAPLMAQTAAIQQSRAETSRMTTTRDEMAGEFGTLIATAARAQEHIHSAPVRGWTGFSGTVRSFPGGVTGRFGTAVRATTRAGLRIGDMTSWNVPPALSRAPAPAGPVTLTHRDRIALNALHALARDLEHAHDPARTARIDLTPEAVSAELFLVMDRLGLRAGQDPARHRWAAVVTDLRRRHGYEMSDQVRALRASRETSGPPRVEATENAAERARQEVRLAEWKAHQAGWQALRAAWAADPLTGTLWTVAARTEFQRLRMDVRPDGWIKMFPATGPRYRIRVVAGATGPDLAHLRLAPDDLWHAIRGSFRDDPHTLVVDPAHVADEGQLVLMLTWATREIERLRLLNGHRVQDIMIGPRESLLTYVRPPVSRTGTVSTLQDGGAPDEALPVTAGPRTAAFAAAGPDAVAPPSPILDTLAADAIPLAADAIPLAADAIPLAADAIPLAADTILPAADTNRPTTAAFLPASALFPSELPERLPERLPEHLPEHLLGPAGVQAVPQALAEAVRNRGVGDVPEPAIARMTALLPALASSGPDGLAAFVGGVMNWADTRLTPLAERLETGSGADVYRVDGPAETAPVVIKVFPEMGQFVEELSALQRLADAGVTVPRVHAVGAVDRKGTPVGTLVMSYARGSTLTDLLTRLHDEGTPQALAAVTAAVTALGRALGELHRQAGPRVSESYLDGQVTWIRQQLAHLLPENVLTQTAELYIRDVMADPGTAGLVHGDLHPGNVVWHPEHGITFIDVAGAHRSIGANGTPVGMPERDVSTFLSKLRSQGTALGLSMTAQLLPLRRAFLRAYEATGVERAEHVVGMYRDGRHGRQLRENVTQLAPGVDLKVFRAEVPDQLKLSEPAAAPNPVALLGRAELLGRRYRQQVAGRIATALIGADAPARAAMITELLDRFTSDLAALTERLRDLLAAGGEATPAYRGEFLKVLETYRGARTMLDQLAFDTGDGALRLPPWEDLVTVQAPPAPAVAPILLGAWSGPPAARAAADIRAHASAAGRPVVAVDLGGLPEVSGPVVAELHRVLTGFRRMRVAPVLVATEATRATGELFADIRREFAPTLIQPASAGFDRVWVLRSPDGESRQMESRLEEAIFEAAGPLAAQAPTPVDGVHLPGALGTWAMSRTWADAAALHRAHEAELHADAAFAALTDAVTAEPGDTRLAAFHTVLDVARTAGRLPVDGEPRLTPVAQSILDVEPPPAIGPRDPATAGFVYDYLSTMGGRADRFAMDGMLFALIMAGALSWAQGLSLVRTTATTPVDRANLAVFETVEALLALAPALTAENPMTHPELLPIMQRLGGVTAGGRNPDCLSPSDRAAWTGRLDAVRDRLRATEPDRAALIETATHLLTNC